MEGHILEGIKIKLPWPPSVNSYWRHNRGITHISNEGRAYREEVSWLLKAKRISFKGLVGMYLVLYPPDNRLRDSDNLLKALYDALEHGGAVENDAYIKEGYYRWEPAIKPGWVLLTLYPLGNSPHKDCHG